MPKTLNKNIWLSLLFAIIVLAVACGCSNVTLTQDKDMPAEKSIVCVFEADLPDGSRKGLVEQIDAPENFTEEDFIQYLSEEYSYTNINISSFQKGEIGSWQSFADEAGDTPAVCFMNDNSLVVQISDHWIDTDVPLQEGYVTVFQGETIDYPYIFVDLDDFDYWKIMQTINLPSSVPLGDPIG